MHVAHLEDLAVVLVLAGDEFVELLDLGEVGLLGGVLLDAAADLDDLHVALVLVVVGQLPVLAEQRHGGLVLAEQEVALGLGEDQVVVVVEVGAVAEGGEAVLVGAVLEEEVAGVLVDLLVLGGEGDVALEVEEGLVGVALDLQALGPLQVGLGVLLVEVDGDGEVLDCLAEVAEDGEDESSQVEVLGDVVLALLDGLVDVGHGLVEVVLVEVQDGAEVEEGGDVVVGQLRQVADPHRHVLDRLLQELVLRHWVVLLLEAVVDDVEGEVEVGLGLVGDELDGLLDGAAGVGGEVLVGVHDVLVVVLGEVVVAQSEVPAQLLVGLVLLLGVVGAALAQFPEGLVEVDQRLEEEVALLGGLLLDVPELELEGGQGEEGLEGVDAVLVLLLHEEEAGLEEESPLVEDVGVDLDVVRPGQDVVGLVEVLLLDLDLHHHFHRGRHVLAVVVALQRLLEAQQRLHDLALSVVDHALVVVRGGGDVALDERAVLQILERLLQLVLLVVEDPPLLVADVPHVGVESGGEGGEGFLGVSEFLLAGALADVGEALGAVEGDGVGEVLEGVEVALLLEVEFAAVDEAVVVVGVEVEALVELRGEGGTMSTASSNFWRRL